MIHFTGGLLKIIAQIEFQLAIQCAVIKCLFLTLIEAAKIRAD